MYKTPLGVLGTCGSPKHRPTSSVERMGLSGPNSGLHAGRELVGRRVIFRMHAASPSLPAAFLRS